MDSATDLFQFADVAWARRGALGLVLIVPGIAGHVFGAVLLWMDLPTAKGLAHAVAAVVLAVGVFLATRKEPGPAAKTSSLALWARVCALASMMVWLILGLIAMKLLVTHGMVKPLVLLVLVIQTALAVLLSYVVSGMALRIPNDTLSSHAIYTGWATAAVCATLLVIQELDLITSVHLMFFTCSFPMIGGFMVILCWAMITLLRMGLDMRAAAQAGAAITSRRQQRLAARR